VAFVVVGDLPVGSTHETLDGYRAEAASRGLEGRLFFTGFRDDAAAIVGELAVLAVPSIRPDPCPRVVLEGLGKGTPVVGSASGGIAETIRDGETGLLARPGDATDLVRQIERILDDRELAARIGEAGRRAAREEFSAESVSRRVQDVLWEAARRGGGEERQGREEEA
jgi:glycosyltransferase involved in cell wall biosynthesis